MLYRLRVFKLTRKRFQQIRNLFDAALSRPEGERAVFLADSCREDSDLREQVCRLLKVRDETVTLTRTDPNARPPETGAPSREGCQLGGYELSRLLGRGGRTK